MAIMIDIGVSVVSGAGGAGLVLWFFKKYINHKFDKKIETYRAEVQRGEENNLSKWKLKREACLAALSIIDGSFSNTAWDTVIPDKQNFSTEKARECYNKLAVTCESEKVLEAYKKCLGLANNVTPDSIVDLRNAIRKELDYGKEFDGADRDNAWIAKLSGSTEPS